MRKLYFNNFHFQKRIVSAETIRGNSVFTVRLTTCLGPKKQGFWPKINCIQMKLPNVLNSSADSLSKIGHDFSNKGVQKLKLSKKALTKNVLLN